MNKTILLAGAAFTTICATPAWAEATAAPTPQPEADSAASAETADTTSGLQEIIVTAQARGQSLRTVPVSVSVVDSKAVQSKGLNRIDDIQYFVPNLKLTEVGITTSIFIRGIGSGENQGFEQSVGLYIDGVYYGRAKEVQAPFIDLDRIEVLRGPQSILFGKNSVAGALSITTARPTSTLKAGLSTSYEFNARDFTTEGHISGPLSDRIRVRGALRYRSSQGFDRNLATGRRNPALEEIGGRGTAEIDVTDTLTATAKVEISQFNRKGRTGETFVSDPIATGPFKGLTYGQILFNVFGQPDNVLDEKFDGRRAAIGETSRNRLETYSLGLDWKLGDYTLKSLSAFTRLKYYDNCDCDFTGANIFTAGFDERFDQTSQEIRLISPEYDKFDFILGAYYGHSDQQYADQIVVPNGSLLIGAINAQAPGFGNLIADTQAARTAHIVGDVYSAFAQTNIHVLPSVTVQLGGRYTYDRKRADRSLAILDINGADLSAAQFAAPLVYANLFGITSQNLANLGPVGAFFIGKLGQLPISGKFSTSRFSPDVKVRWEFAPRQMVYATWQRGYKSGGFDFRSNNKSISATLADSFQFRDEQATNYEVGGKFSLGRNVQLNVAAFLTKYKDLQVAIFDGILGYNVGNAAAAKVKGIEFDARWAVTPRLSISAAGAFTDFKFTNYPNGQCYFGQTPTTDLNGDGVADLCSYNGKPAQLVSKFEGTATVDYTMPVFTGYKLNAAADVSYKGRYDASPLYDPKAVQNAYAMVNLRLALSPDSENWQLALFAKNVTNKRPLTYGGAVPLAAGLFGSNSLTGIFAQGRQISVQARMKF
ncbi:TonB-dependent receptor [Novosphingobium sediminis]|uniref:TonB-dependent receptor n=1 Tax=Novosphingobium sediminis TaxID=707214 RepID=A0A512AP87_9SPHN|nr:TonB-dependent receptor [Novosphingobium sediminis]GEO01522.1 TonB-dependent receptor [Novosphingobium sediminis]